jgi:hypothetical protein
MLLDNQAPLLLDRVFVLGDAYTFGFSTRSVAIAARYSTPT